MGQNQRVIYITKTYKQRIKKTHPLYQTFIDLTIKSKNLYNLALYTERQYYFEHKKIISRFSLISLLKKVSAFAPYIQALSTLEYNAIKINVS